MFSFNKIQPTTSTSGLSTSTSQPNFFGQPAATAGAAQPQQQQTSATGGGGLFSFNKPADQSGGGLFGGGTNTQANTSGGFFGNKPAGTTTATGGLNTSSTFGSGLLLNKPTATASPFGQAAAPGTTTTGGGIFGGLGSQPATGSTPSLFGGTSTNPAAANTSFGFGQPQQTTTTGGLFGQTAQGGANTSATGGSIFSLGAPKPTTSLFGGGGGMLGQPAAQTTGTSFLGGQAAPATQNINQPDPQDLLIYSLVNPQVFNDERDTILAKWNQLQAYSGVGKIFFQSSALDVPKENILNRFKTIGYSCRPTNKNEDGLVGLIINKKEADVRADQKSITTALHKIFNSDASLSVVIESIKPVEDDKCEVVFYLNQRVSQLTDQTNRIASSIAYQHLTKQEAPTGLLSGLKTTLSTKQQLDQMGVLRVYPLVGMSDEEVKTYLETVPSGLNPVLWEQARKNNPNSKKLIPVQIVGFQEINKRFKLQEEENKSQKSSLAIISNSIDNLNDRNKILRSKIEQFKARNEDLEQRTLKVMINYEIRRKIGLPLQENEKYLLGLLESIQMELSSPINKEIQRQKISEFNDIVKSLEMRKRQQQQQQQLQQQQQQQQQSKQPLGVHSSTSMSNIDSGVVFEPSSLGDIQRSLREQQKAFKSLIDMIHKDSRDLELMRKSILNEK